MKGYYSIHRCLNLNCAKSFSAYAPHTQYCPVCRVVRIKERRLIRTASEKKPVNRTDYAQRLCLKCDESFESYSIHNRICGLCGKSNSSLTTGEEYGGF